METSILTAARQFVGEYRKKFVLPDHLTSDAVQEVGLKLWESKNSYNPGNKGIPYYTSNYARLIAYRTIRELHLKDRNIVSIPNAHQDIDKFLEAEKEVRVVRLGTFDVTSRGVVFNTEGGEDCANAFLLRSEPVEELTQEDIVIRNDLIGIANRSMKFVSKHLPKSKTKKSIESLAKGKPVDRSGSLMARKKIRDSKMLKEIHMELEEVRK